MYGEDVDVCLRRRLAGLALVVTSGWALWMGLVHDTAPWCSV
mgnify:CR=1 FL=1